MTRPTSLAACPAIIGINIDIESLDAQSAGSAGLFGRYSYGRYGFREGIERFVRTLAQLDVKATFYALAADLSRHPELAGSLLDAGHEIAVRGRVDKDAGAQQLLDALGEEREAMTRALGHAPKGWRAVDGIVTEQTLPALANLGYAYDASFMDDDAPYTLKDGSGAQLVELPVCDYLSDAPFYTQRHTHARVQKAWLEEAEAQYCAAGYIHLTLHTRGDTGSSRLPRIAVVANFIRHLQGRPGVAFYRSDELASLWREHAEHSYDFPIAPKPNL
ncbi:MAG TPA: polysaccharide deacetylase family protein [Ramlibacter sp.]|nr:polysaccharide deacetylase family protein [Ramlibacter sp.]